MKAFRFPLEKVLAWRRVQLEVEENKLRQLYADAARLDRERAGWEAAGIRAEADVREWTSLAGRDLEALAAFRVYVKQQERALSARRAECQQRLASGQQALLEARRRCRLLERLRERRLAEWQAGNDREIEQLASESHLAGIVRRRA